MDTMFEDVKAFQRKFQLGEHPPIPTAMDAQRAQERMTLIREEVAELETAIAENDIEGQADALVDIVYVVLGTASVMGLPWEELWADVQRANMSKVRGMTKRGHANDVTKPEGWQGPRTAAILLKALRRGR